MKTIRNYQLIFIVLSLITLFGCNSQKTKEKGIIETIEQEMNIQLKNETKEGALEEFYTYRFYHPFGVNEGIKIKGIIDKSLGVLPSVVKEGKFNKFGEKYDHYKWETPQQEVTLENRWEENQDNSENRDTYIRIWIFNK